MVETVLNMQPRLSTTSGDGAPSEDTQVSKWSYREAAGGVPESAREPVLRYTQLRVWARPLTRTSPPGVQR
jgi:hypothetical protein